MMFCNFPIIDDIDPKSWWGCQTSIFPNCDCFESLCGCDDRKSKESCTENVYSQIKTVNRLKRIRTCSDCVRLLQRLQNNSTDDILICLLNLYSISPPDDEEIKKLNALYNSVAHTGGCKEYAALTIWLSAVESVKSRSIN